MVTIYNTTLSATSQRHFSDSLGGGKTYVHHETRLLACVKTADLLTTAQFSGMMCAKNVLLRTSPWYFPQLGLVAQI